ncbi:MAG TPA: hypothetical protein VHY59_00080 [Chthoniobacterales bacterium]|jgi:hypothetical protein|nr:hypothetical protein [Chthoniobacterales bacterium]
MYDNEASSGFMESVKNGIEVPPRIDAVSPTNQAFIKEYRGALQAFLRKHRNDADPGLILECEERSNSLEQTD